MTEHQKPVLIETGRAHGDTPDNAPPVPDIDPPRAPGGASEAKDGANVRRSSPLARIFWGLAVTLITIILVFEAWSLVAETLEFNPILGAVVAALLASLFAVLLLIAVKEFRGFSNLKRPDALRRNAETALDGNNLEQSRRVIDRVVALYADRPALQRGIERVHRQRNDIFEPSALYGLAEVELLLPLDRDAEAEIKAAMRKVAVATAIVPIGLVDVVVSLVASLRMIRAIAGIYGNRCGVLGAWPVVRGIMGTLAVSGAAGSKLLTKFFVDGVASRIAYSAAEGVINSIMMARVGTAAMKVCRPLPFGLGRQPNPLPLLKDVLVEVFGEGMKLIFKREQDAKKPSPDEGGGGEPVS